MLNLCLFYSSLPRTYIQFVAKERVTTLKPPAIPTRVGEYKVGSPFRSFFFL